MFMDIRSQSIYLLNNNIIMSLTNLNIHCFSTKMVFLVTFSTELAMLFENDEKTESIG